MTSRRTGTSTASLHAGQPPHGFSQLAEELRTKKAKVQRNTVALPPGQSRFFGARQRWQCQSAPMRRALSRLVNLPTFFFGRQGQRGSTAQRRSQSSTAKPNSTLMTLTSRHQSRISGQLKISPKPETLTSSNSSRRNAIGRLHLPDRQFIPLKHKSGLSAGLAVVLYLMAVLRFLDVG